MKRLLILPAHRLFFAGLGLILFIVIGMMGIAPPQALAQGSHNLYLPSIFNLSRQATYVVLGWNDLGMHCYDRDYSVLSVLPPYNTLYAQVIQRGDPPRVITGGITVEYSIPGNTTSVTKTNFWQYSQKLFNVALAPDVGLTGKGLSGRMDSSRDHFVAEGIPLTEFTDKYPNTNPNYFQLAHLTVKNLNGTVLAQTEVVAPVSSEMRCDVCHNSPSPTDFRMNILNKHDEEEGTHFAQQAAAGTPVLCANCHADPALGMPGQAGKPSLSAAMHSQHEEETSDCYACHPGPNTRCLRDVMSVEEGMTCIDCHQGGMHMLADESRVPWHDEPRCANCHEPEFAENVGALYRLSKGHGGLYCESCHNSTHAILASRVAADNRQAISLQGHAGTIEKCTVCHLTQPTGAGPHQ